jgi:probable rRNA maturation factor
MTRRVAVTVAIAAAGLDPERLEEVVERAVLAVLEDRGVGEAEISVALLDDAAMAGMNQEWKGRAAATDVLAFSLHEAGDAPLGDVYLGVERAVEQGREAGETPERELARLAIHATLHVLGWDHPEEAREASELWRHQERILEGLHLP